MLEVYVSGEHIDHFLAYSYVFLLVWLKVYRTAPLHLKNDIYI